MKALLLLFLFSLVHGHPPDIVSHPRDGGKSPANLEGHEDIAHGRGEQLAETVNQESGDVVDFKLRNKRSGIYNVSFFNNIFWDKNKPIRYGFDSKYTEKDQEFINLRLMDISENTCIKFVQPSSGDLELSIVRQGVCGSYAFGNPKYTYRIDVSECMTWHYGVYHEFFHALGLSHTQSRADRDNFITFREGTDLRDGRFQKLNNSVLLDPFVSYDYNSIMHYGPVFVNGVPTIIPRDIDYFASIGQGIYPSFSDFKQINMLYKCGDQCPPIKCENGGYQHPKSCGRCVCHDFASGDRCQFLDVVPLLPGGYAPFLVDEKDILTNITFHPEMNKIRPLAFLAPYGTKLLVKIDYLDLPEGHLPTKCHANCFKAAFEFVDREDGDLTMGGKMFCCGNRQGEEFVTKSNVLGFTGHLTKGMNASIVFTVEVYNPLPDAGEPVWKLPNGDEPLILSPPW